MTLCVKYGESVNDHDSTAVMHKRSGFIGYFNKFMSKFAFIQPTILCHLLKTYCRSYYGSILCHSNYHGFDKYCIQWNTLLRKIFYMSNTSHIWLLLFIYIIHISIYGIHVTKQVKFKIVP